MSGFAVIFERSNTPVDSGVFERVMQRLSHRGPDGQDSWLSDTIALGHWHFWTTPEEQGERQPLKLTESPLTIVMDGRLDNRSELIKRLNIHLEEGSNISDANLVLQAFARWGTNCFQDLIGEFGVVIWNSENRELICARDAVGDRTLFYAFTGTRLVIASEPWAVAAASGKQVELDERAIAYHFAQQIPEDGQTFFKGIYELLPAYWMKVDFEKNQQERYWQPTLEKPNLKRTNTDYVEEFRELLEESVRCRLRSTTSPGIMLSGGLDSTSIACLAARMVTPEQLTTISYVFDEFTDCDERQYIDAVRDQYDMRSIQIPCDDLWPFKTLPAWPLDPNWPPANPYRLILERTYSRAQDEGLRVLLTGMYGDILYARSADWLADLFLNGCFNQLGQEISYLVKNYSYRKILDTKILRRTVKQVLFKILKVNSLRGKPTAPKWLTANGAGYLYQKKFMTENIQQSVLLNLRDAASNTREVHYSSRFNIELRTPYHDRRLIDFILGLPGYVLYSKGVTRRILRNAMAEILPGIINARMDKTTLLSLYNYGVQQKAIEIEGVLNFEDANWKKYVESDFFLSIWRTPVSPQSDGQNSVLLVLCIFYELWYKSQFGSEIFGGINSND